MQVTGSDSAVVVVDDGEYCDVWDVDCDSEVSVGDGVDSIDVGVDYKWQMNHHSYLCAKQCALGYHVHGQNCTPFG